MSAFKRFPCDRCLETELPNECTGGHCNLGDCREEAVRDRGRRIKEFGVSCRFSGIIAAIAMLSATGGSDRADARSAKVSIATAPQVLFRCQTDQVLSLRPSGDSEAQKNYAVSHRRTVPGEVRLVINGETREMTVVVQLRGRPTHAYALSSVEQGSSPGSGTGGRADTTIRGRSGKRVFTLSANYDSNGFDHDGSLQVEGINTFQLVCDDSQYLAPQAIGMGRFGFTNIYRLSADGLAKEMNLSGPGREGK